MRRIVYILLLPLFVQAQQHTVHADTLLTFAHTHVGVPYRYAQCTPAKGFDCSGFVYYVFSHFGVKVPRASMDYEKAGRSIPLDSCHKGDVIVFTGTNPGNRKPGHVGLVAANDSAGISFIHSSSGRGRIGVIVTNFTLSKHYRERFIKVIRLEAVRFD